MQIKDIKKARLNSTVRVEGEILTKNGGKETLFFEVSGVNADMVSTDGSSFLVAMLPSAMAQNENIEIENTVSRKVLANSPKVQNILSKFNPHFKEVTINVSGTVDRIAGKRIGCFFSGGVDSFYVYLKNKKESFNKITDFILVIGFDVPLHNTKLTNEVIEKISEIAKTENINLIIVKTNLREISDRVIEWDWQIGAALGSISLLLRSYFKTVYIAGSATAEAHIPYGTHPELDPLWSSEKMTIIHDGAEHVRLERIKKYIARSPLALKYIRVCWKNVTNKYNCSECEKCQRTMIELKIAGALEKAQTFTKPLEAKKIKAIRLPENGWDLAYEDILIDLKSRDDLKDINDAVIEMLQLNKNPGVIKKVFKLIRKMDQDYAQGKLFWTFSKWGVC